ncbi:error-prone DNA polymerase [Demequina sp. SYSU T00192]|uniref:Error-prone DNA polymerase n=1 Tax=Demequina litoralis TaxID=3051660 RepID=A0ABT8G525_9MICO|nr:error-prone DNA polymerase [Demequina sp. SYSU T00192]MDN4474236.1 error-prone DNA polymerase [Demequina sp. SYSU T00192]
MTDVPEYAELHAHSAFSFLDGASQPEEMAAEAGRLGLGALALTDHDGLYGAVRFAGAAREIGLPTVFGAELSLAADGPGGRPVLDPPTGVPDPRASHLVVLARGAGGYSRLSHAIGMAHLATGEKGLARYTLETLADAGGGDLLVLTGCRKGPVRAALTGLGGPGLGGTARRAGHDALAGGVSREGHAAARAELDRLVALFGREGVAVEITDTGSPFDSEVNAALADLAFDTGLPLVATTNAHYATPRDADLAGALAAVRARSSLDDMDGWLPGSPGQHLRSAGEMLFRHRRHPQAVATAARLAAECAFDLDLVAPNLPPYPVPPGHTEATWLRELAYRGARERYGPPDAERVKGAWQQIEHELAVIEALDFPGYFLIVHDIVAFCRRADILCQGRGSAANSAVCFALGVTAVDAVTHGLLFERFLAPERDGPPDIDVDIESDRREEVIQYVFSRFGRINAAMVANVIQYRPRSAVRDAARALGFDVGQQDAWSKSIDRWSTLRMSPQQEEEWAAKQRDAMWPEPPPAQELDHIPDNVLELADRFLRLPRHLGIHPGGMVLCDRPVIDVCPVEWARMPGRTVLQWDKDDCADAGLVKFDLLGLGMLSALKYAFRYMQETRGEDLGLHSLPQEDPAVYDLLCAADTVGVFQVESRAQMATLPRLRPRRFYDIVIEVALIRPGPIQGGSVHPYINRARGREEVTYLHPLLERSLGKTLGVPLFQEQLMQMAMDAAGFDGALADQLRRAMGSKRSPERMEALRARFMVGANERGITAEVAHQIFDKLKAFADFGFPESHSFSFAYLVYASSWLKVHRPAAFYAGLLAAQPMGFYSPQSLAADARRHGQAILRPCVMRSEVLARVEELAVPFEAPGERREEMARLVRVDPTLAVRMGLGAVRGLGDDAAAAIVAARAERPFADLHDMARRVRIRPKGVSGQSGLAPEKGLSTAQWEALATAGALESLGVTRREGLWASGVLSREGPDTLPGTVPGAQAPMLPGMSVVEEAVADVWASGVSVEGYPTAFVRDGLDRAGVLRVAEVLAHEAERRVTVAGVVTHRQRPGTARGVTFISLEDETGFLNVICSVGVWKRFQAVARRSPALIIRGRIERADGATNLVAEHLSPMSLKVPSRSRDFR